jgi:hypothetical protein
MLRQSKALFRCIKKQRRTTCCSSWCCGPDDTTIGHWAWHQFVERYKVVWIYFTHCQTSRFIQFIRMEEKSDKMVFLNHYICGCSTKLEFGRCGASRNFGFIASEQCQKKNLSIGI